jgi:hypothetical protein
VCVCVSPSELVNVPKKLSIEGSTQKLCPSAQHVQLSGGFSCLHLAVIKNIKRESNDNVLH